MRDDYSQNEGFVKPDAEEYKRSKNYGSSGKYEKKKEKKVEEHKK